MGTKRFFGHIFVENGDGEEPSRESGVIEVSGMLLKFMNDNRSVSFEAHNAHISFGGTANRIAFISHDTQKGIKIHTTDFSIFREPAFANNAKAQSVIKGKKNYNRYLVLTGFLLAFLTLAPLYLVFIERNIVSGFIASYVPPSVEESIGDKLFELQFAGSETIIDDPDILVDLERLTAPLLAVAEESGYDFKVHIMKQDVPNAFALPGGHMVILSGLIEQSDGPEELLGVLGHEMAHVTERHSLRQAISELSGYVLMSILLGGGNDLVYSIGSNARYLLSQHYSRAQEEEADEVGFEYLTKANISPEGLISFFAKLQEENALVDNKWIELISTHPSSERRVENLQKMLDDYDGEFEEIDFPYQKFKEKIANYSK